MKTSNIVFSGFIILFLSFTDNINLFIKITSHGYIMPKKIASEANHDLKKLNKHLKNKAQKIKFVLTDNDGVLTDTGVYYSERGGNLQTFFYKRWYGSRTA